ncbi:MAG: hypothetical protein JW941_05090 [Candidatus Coatesbacteria bacterium]|nr:hypothetical protein [Candidatus Coatesbacteria bacterium]
MQNQYCCDQGDFGKYGLLRWLCFPDPDGEGLRIGLMWYLVPNEANSDGKHISYLYDTPKNRRKFRICDPVLWEELKGLLESGKRNIQESQRSGILPAETVYFGKELKWPEDMPANTPAGQEARRKCRSQWWQQGFDRTQDCQVVFFDPDNGLSPDSVKQYRKKGPKFAFNDEITPFYKRGQSVILYQHINRSEKAHLQIEWRLEQIQKASGAKSGFALHYHRGTARAYLVIPTDEHAALLQSRAREMCNGLWGKQGHFSYVEMCIA